MVEIKDKDPSLDSESDSENTDRRQIIATNPISIIATASIQPEEPIDLEEGEFLFHSHMWVKGPRCILFLIVEAKITSSQ